MSIEKVMANIQLKIALANFRVRCRNKNNEKNNKVVKIKISLLPK